MFPVKNIFGLSKTTFIIYPSPNPSVFLLYSSHFFVFKLFNNPIASLKNQSQDASVYFTKIKNRE